jgi:hypothetical protein
MTKFPSQKQVVDATLKGIVKASKNFLVWTNDRLFLSHGPYKIISIHIAQEIATIKDAPEIFIDATISDILRCSLPDRTAYTAYMKEKKITQGIFSITLDERFEHQNDEDSISKVIMSIRNGVRNPKLEYSNDIEVICKMLDCETSLEYGIFCFYSDLSSNARKKLDKRIPELVKSFDVVVKKFPNLKSSFISSEVEKIEDSGEWLAGCYIVEPK